MRNARSPRIAAPIVITLVLVLSFAFAASLQTHAAAPTSTTAHAVSLAPSAVTTPPVAAPAPSDSGPLQQAVQSLESGVGPAAGLHLSCTSGSDSASCGLPRASLHSAADSHPGFYSYANYSDMNWTNVSSSVGGQLGAADNGVATYDPGMQAVVYYGGGYFGCFYGTGCASNNTWIYQNGTWTNWTGIEEFFGNAPSLLGATFTYDPAWGGSILAGGNLGATTFVNPYTYLFQDYYWTNITSLVGTGPATVWGSAAYDDFTGQLIYLHGCSYYYCNATNEPRLDWVLNGTGTWYDATGLIGSPDVWGFGSELAYDVLDQEMVYYGGAFYQHNGTLYSTNDTWVLPQDGTWENISTTSDGFGCVYSLCFNTYPIASTFGSMTWDGQLNAILLFGGIDANGYVTDQTYMFYIGHWYPTYFFNLNATSAPSTAWAAMPSNSSDIAPVLIGGNCYFNQSQLFSGPYGYPQFTGDRCSNSTWVFEIPPEPFVTSISPNPTDVGVSVAVSAYNTLDSGSGPNLTMEFLTGLGGALVVDYDVSLNFTTNASVSPTIVYLAPGTTVVIVFAVDFWDVVGLNYTGVTVNANLTASPAADPAAAELDQAGQAEVNFTSGAAFGQAPFTYAWSFGAGQGTSTAANPTHTYATSGSFTVWCNVTDALGSTTAVPLTEVVYPMLTASGTANATHGSDVGGAVTFTGTTTGGSGGDTYAWSLGGSHTSSAQNPSVTYSTAGTYTVYFNVSDSLGYHASSHFTFVVAAQLAAAPTESSATPTTATSVSFSPGITGGTAPYAYSWNFGAGQGTSTSASPSHTFGSTGTYTITVTITDAYGEKVTKTLTVTVSQAPASGFIPGTSPTESYILLAVIVLIVVGAIAFLAMRRRRGGATTAPPAAWNQGTAGAPPSTTPTEGPTAPPSAGGSPPTPPPGSS